MTRRPYREHPYRDVPYLLNSQPGRLHHAPLAFAHRGADPERENTMAAFRHAVQLGYRYLEIDVRTSADGQLVIFHDETLDRVTDGSGPLSDKTWAELAELRVIGAAAKQAARRTTAGELTDSRYAAHSVKQEGTQGPGEPLVRFAEALEAFPDIHFNVDLKDAASVEPFARIVEEFGAHHRVLAASFNDARRHRVRKLLGNSVATSGGWVSTALIVLLGPLGFMRRLSGRVARIDCVQVPIQRGRIRVVTPQFIERCHRAGLQVHVWVVDEPAQMHQLLDLGVDGLMTDDAEALAQVMRERSVWPQNG
ncbi:glycerophosphodiester phosphodiesterase [Nesterenkonia sp.]|uniref:glycerophosphodiester phosphodiesterase n=1 Tax=Nesterenkonia sp. TaxID=704201 RepID=UPI002607220E|nr:glycerophosphodiester phosphodiesterase [Nesterenkonia sp.]